MVKAEEESLIAAKDNYATFKENQRILPDIGPLRKVQKLRILFLDRQQLNKIYEQCIDQSLRETELSKRENKMIFLLSDSTSKAVYEDDILNAALLNLSELVCYHGERPELGYFKIEIGHQDDNGSKGSVLGTLIHPIGIAIYNVVQLDKKKRKFGVVEAQSEDKGLYPAYILDKTSGFKTCCKELCCCCCNCESLSTYKLSLFGRLIAKFSEVNKKGARETEIFDISFTKRCDLQGKIIAVGIGLLLCVQDSRYTRAIRMAKRNETSQRFIF